MSSHRIRSLQVTVVVALAALLGSFVAAPSASAAHRYAAKVRTHVTKTVQTTQRAVVAATASVTVGSPPVTAKVTVRAAGTAKASATRTSWATALRSAATFTRAKKVARRAARAEAAKDAATRAGSVARTRALSAARADAQANAEAAAKAAALQKARDLAGRPTTASTGCTSLPKAGGGTWTCTFDEEFNGTSLDASKWIPVTTSQNGYAGGQACLVDSKDNISVGGGALNLTVRKTAAPFTCSSPKGAFTTSYTGGQVATYGKFAQTYGRFAVRAKFPASTIAGLQSTLWMWPQNNVSTGLTGEIDIAEAYSNYADRIIPYLHYPYDKTTTKIDSTDPLSGTNVVTNNQFLVDNINAFHEYAVEWTPTTISIFIDGRTVLVDRLAPLGTSPFDQPYFLALTACLGIGTNAFDAATTQLPATTQIDWVRAWK